jgi:hypothetical protein
MVAQPGPASHRDVPGLLYFVTGIDRDRAEEDSIQRNQR